jgi:hypothetical protein
MVLSNAERQARFQKRLRERATLGVTPDMVIKAARLAFDDWMRVDGESEGDPRSWNGILTEARKRGKAHLWLEWVPTNPDCDYSEFNDDAPLMRAVARVAAAVLRPPKAD